MLGRVLNILQPFRARPAPAPPVDPVAENLRLRAAQESARHARSKPYAEALNRHMEAHLWRGQYPIRDGR